MIQIFFLTLAISVGVEFGKLYRVPWLDDFRATAVGHLLLGSSFSWQNLLAYAAGAAVGGMLDVWLLSRGNCSGQPALRRDS